MGERWFEEVRPLCKEACLAAAATYPVEVSLFYLARWTQKKAERDRPDLSSFAPEVLRDGAEKIVANLETEGAQVESLVAGDPDAWTTLKGIVLRSARRRVGEGGGEHTDEALQKIALVLLTGTPPSRAAEQLELGPDGPKNEYVFHSPFTNWARLVAINLIVDELRREARERRPPTERGPRKIARLSRATLREALDGLPSLMGAVRALPPVQRSVLVLSLCRRNVEEEVRERLHELAPDLFSFTDDPPSSDEDIADRLGTTAQLVRANRSAARVKLAKRDRRWALLLDALLPHRSTRRPGVGSSVRDPAGVSAQPGDSDA